MECCKLSIEDDVVRGLCKELVSAIVSHRKLRSVSVSHARPPPSLRRHHSEFFASDSFLQLQLKLWVCWSKLILYLHGVW
ncbi:hypothetical protein VNO80_16291 [Phaseolus coccineus]|uniref:Uncharacterized protein n=1 Tax=Phaseolus coccineus TaxID=3886 RepID=A0AAN9MLT2_PHACN